MRILASLAIAAMAVFATDMARSQDLNSHYTPHEQSAGERLQNFQPPPPPPPPSQPRVEVGTMHTCCTEDHVHTPPIGPSVTIHTK